MKKLFFLFCLPMLIFMGCNNQKPKESTVIRFFTPIGNMYYFNGKIQKMTEKNYWAKVESGKYLKGDKITRKELDSMKWIPDYEVNLTRDGLVESCFALDENGNTIWKNQLKIENGKYIVNQYYREDTVRYYENIKYNDKGEIAEIIRYRAVVDTLMGSGIISSNSTGDTITIKGLNFKGETAYQLMNYYNRNKNCTAVLNYGPDGVLRASTEYLYNDKGDVLKSSYYDKDKNLTNWEEYIYFEYDKLGNFTVACYKDAQGRLAITERTFTYYEPDKKM